MDKQAIAVLPAQQALEQLHTSPEGLSSSEAEKRRATLGLNVLTKSKHTALDVLGRQLIPITFLCGKIKARNIYSSTICKEMHNINPTSIHPRRLPSATVS